MNRTQARLKQLESRQPKPLPCVSVVYSIVERDASGQLWCTSQHKRDKDTGQLVEICNKRRPIDG